MVELFSRIGVDIALFFENRPLLVIHSFWTSSVMLVLTDLITTYDAEKPTTVESKMNNGPST